MGASNGKEKLTQPALLFAPTMVTQTDLMRIKNCPPDLVALFSDMKPIDLTRYVSGVIAAHRLPRKETAADGTISYIPGREISVAEALQYAASKAQEYIAPKNPVSGDFKSGALSGARQRLSRVIRGPVEALETNLNAAAGLIGAETHRMVFGLMDGSYPSYKNAQALIAQDRSAMSQGLWEGKLDQGVHYAEGILENDQLAEWYLSEIASCRIELAEGLVKGVSMWEMQEAVNRMYLMLRPIFGRHMESINQFRNTEFFSLAMSNLGTAVLTLAPDVADNAQRILLTEIPVVENNIAGRADGLEIITIGDLSVKEYGERFPQKMRLIRDRIELARTSTNGGRFKSIGHAISILENLVGERLTCTVLEFKSQVGDDPTPGKRRRPLPLDAILNQPHPSHERQVRGYITSGNKAYNVARQEDPHGKNLGAIEGATITYAHSEEERLIIHMVKLSDEGQESHFTTNVAQRAAFADGNSRKRGLFNFLILDLEQMQRGAEDAKKRTRRQPAAGQHPLLGTTFRHHIDAQRIYADEDRIIEIVGTNDLTGRPRYSIDYNAFIEARNAATQQGKRFRDSFKEGKGGMVSCIFPEHPDDDRPSLHLDEESGCFFCFGCHAGGRLQMGSAERQFSGRVRTASTTESGDFIPLNEIVVPNEQLVFMSVVQEIVTEELRTNKRGQKYLEARGIPLELAIAYGAGYCNGERLIKTLFQRGYTTEQLIHYGILMPTDGGNEIVLADSVTFPVKLQSGQISNFYGRRVDNRGRKDLSHRKLPVRNTGVPMGIFNVEALEAGGDIIVVEGVMDALSLMAMGYKNVIALIGTYNYLALAEVTRRADSIGIGLDNDNSGISIAANLSSFLKTIGFSAEKIRSFTGEFFSTHPEIGQFKDFNDVLRFMLKNRMQVSA